MEVKFDIVQPNLYVQGNDVCFGLNPSELIPASRAIDNIIGEQIGILKVRNSDLEAVRFGESKEVTEKFDTPLKEYLDFIEKECEHSGKIGAITNPAAKLFGLSYFISSRTYKSSREIIAWNTSKRGLTNPNEFFDNFEKNEFFLRVDREKTLGQIKKVHEELDLKIPDNCVDFTVIRGFVPDSERKLGRAYLGIVSLWQAKSTDKSLINKSKADLVKRLKEFRGPCLSFDAVEIYNQTARLYYQAPDLINQYGDILKSPSWQTRMFKLDP